MEHGAESRICFHEIRVAFISLKPEGQLLKMGPGRSNATRWPRGL